MSKPRYLTKSRFKLATECPTKLFYTGKDIYPDKKIEDSFLMALAEGGFQVGELAKCYYPDGHDIHSLDYEEALAQTNELLKQDNVIIYEAAVRYQNLFIRMDVLVKQGNRLELIEVKSKSTEHDDEDFMTKKGEIRSGWQPYLYDVAFQKYVLSKAFPDCSVSAYLMMADKKATCPTDGLNQKFRIIKDAHGRKSVYVSESLSPDDLSEKILCLTPVDKYCEIIYQAMQTLKGRQLNFEQWVEELVSHYVRDEKICCHPSKTCGTCEFKASQEEEAAGKKSGFKECWKNAFGWTQKDFDEPTVLDIWNYRKKDAMLAAGLAKMSDVTEDNIGPEDNSTGGLTPKQRQWMQIQKSQERNNSYWLDADNLKQEMQQWVYPLHFIDFETTMVAIPFNKGLHPYEGVAFQFSHHTMQKNGQVEHKGQYLNAEPGVFPNYDFLRALKSELEHDNGSIFCYSKHENTFLNHIYRQIQSDPNVQDSQELCDFIQSITFSSGKEENGWSGDRQMVDLWDLVKRYYYDPLTGGSNSIKYVLPAILNRSKFLHEKYGKPVYGAAGGIPSLNFKNWRWIEMEDGVAPDPYHLLPKMFQDVSEQEMELLTEDSEINNGGAAMTAYARMQFEEMSDYERSELTSSLLKYCELDTLAMVMIVEGWKDMI